MENKVDAFMESRYVSRILHLGLLVASAYLAANPEYAWVIPVLQGLGQASSPPK